MSAKKATQKSAKSTHEVQGIHGRGTSRDEGARQELKAEAAKADGERAPCSRRSPR